MSDSKQPNNQQNEEPEDPVELMLQKTGCTELHYKVQVNRHFYFSVQTKVILSSCFFSCSEGVHSRNTRLAQVQRRGNWISTVYVGLYHRSATEIQQYKEALRRLQAAIHSIDTTISQQVPA